MDDYEKIYERSYPGGWKDLPDETTPIAAEALNRYDNAIEHIEEYLDNMDFSPYATENYVDTKVNEALGNILGGAS